MLLIGWILVFQIHVNIGIEHFGILRVMFHVIVLFIGRLFMLLLARGFVPGALQSRIIDGVHFALVYFFDRSRMLMLVVGFQGCSQDKQRNKLRCVKTPPCTILNSTINLEIL